MKKIVFVLLIIFVPSMVFANSNAFSDVSSDDTYFDAIEFLSSENIVQGYPDGTFKPYDPINRAEMLKMIVEGYAIYKNIDTSEIDKYANDKCFYDIEPGEWYTKYICYAKANDWIAGYPFYQIQEFSYLRNNWNGLTKEEFTNPIMVFLPANTVNVVEGLKIVLKGFGVEANQKDGEVWYKGYVDAASAKNYIPFTVAGFNDWFVREEVSDMITRIIKDEQGKLDEYLGLRADNIVTFKTIEDRKSVSYLDYLDPKYQSLTRSECQMIYKDYLLSGNGDGSDMDEQTMTCQNLFYFSDTELLATKPLNLTESQCVDKKAKYLEYKNSGFKGFIENYGITYEEIYSCKESYGQVWAYVLSNLDEGENNCSNKYFYNESDGYQFCYEESMNAELVKAEIPEGYVWPKDKDSVAFKDGGLKFIDGAGNMYSYLLEGMDLYISDLEGDAGNLIRFTNSQGTDGIKYTYVIEGKKSYNAILRNRSYMEYALLSFDNSSDLNSAVDKFKFLEKFGTGIEYEPLNLSKSECADFKVKYLKYKGAGYFGAIENYGMTYDQGWSCWKLYPGSWSDVGGDFGGVGGGN